MRNLMLRPSRFDLAGELNYFLSDFRSWPIWDRQNGFFVPATDIEETDDAFTVSGEKESTTGVEDKDYVRSEIQYGSFSRSFALPKTVDVGNVSADYRDGLLTVTLRKTEAAKPKQIEVKTK